MRDGRKDVLVVHVSTLKITIWGENTTSTLLTGLPVSNRWACIPCAIT